MKSLLGTIFCLVAVLCLAGPAAAAEFSGRPLKMTAVTEENQVFLNALDQWLTVPGMVVDFTTTKDGPAEATFCTELTTLSPLLIRLRQPGVGDWAPGPTQIAEEVLTFQTQCFSWFASLPAGTYRVKVQWKNLPGPLSPIIRKRLVRVGHEN